MAMQPAHHSMRRAAVAAGRSITALPNVRFVALGEKRRGGVRTGEQALVAYVTKKLDLSLEDRVPEAIKLNGRLDKSELRTLPTDVVELPSPPIVFNARSGSLVRGFDGDTGICGLAFVKSAAGYIITNAHVVVNVARGGARGNVAVLNSQTRLFELAGPIVYATDLSRGATTMEDCALIQSGAVQVDHFKILGSEIPISGLNDIAAGDNGDYFFDYGGVGLHCSHPEFVVGSLAVDVDGVIVNYTNVWHLHMTSGTSAPGQSGAVLCKLSGGNIVACGLVFGGIAPTSIFVLPLRKIFNSLYNMV